MEGFFCYGVSTVYESNVGRPLEKPIGLPQTAIISANRWNFRRMSRSKKYVYISLYIIKRFRRRRRRDKNREDEGEGRGDRVG